MLGTGQSTVRRVVRLSPGCRDPVPHQDWDGRALRHDPQSFCSRGEEEA